MKGRVLLMVPPYARMRRPLDTVEYHIETGVSDRRRLEKYRGIIKRLRDSGISELEEMKRSGMPLGLMRVGRAAKSRGYDVQIVDSPFEDWDNEIYLRTDSSSGNVFSRYGLSEKKLRERISGYGPDAVGITCPYTHQKESAKWLAGIVKDVTSGRVPVIYGGPGPTAEPAEFIEDGSDYVVMRQGDGTFPELLDCLLGHGEKDIRQIKGVKGRDVDNPGRGFIRALNELSMPDLDMLDLELYNARKNSMGEDPVSGGYQATIFTSAGCNTGCYFCQIPAMQGAYSVVGGDRLREIFGYLKKRNVRHLLIEDDNIAHDMHRLENIYSVLEGTGMSSSCEGGISMYGFNYLQMKDGKGAERVIRQMADGGCRHIYLAGESGNVPSLSASHKPEINADFILSRNTVSMFRKYGIKVTLGSILGMPRYMRNPDGTEMSETVEEVEHTISYMNALGADFHNPFISTPLPGTRYGDRFKKFTKPGHGCSHEFATYDAPGGEWIGDELNLLRVHAMGIANYKKTLETGTWA